MTSPQKTLEDAAETIVRDMQERIQRQAALLDMTVEAFQRAVIAEMVGEERLTDGRARLWHVRGFLFDVVHSPNYPERDTDPDVRYGSPGRTIIRGLPTLLVTIPELAVSHHHLPCVGLDRRTLGKKLQTLRTLISQRGDGTGTLRANYEVHANGQIRYMLVRVEVERADKNGNAPTVSDGRKLPRMPTGAAPFPSL